MRESKITPVHYEVLIKIFELDGFAVQRKKEIFPLPTRFEFKELGYSVAFAIRKRK